MKPTLQEQIEQSMKSLNGIRRAEASPFLFGKIMHRHSNQLAEPVYYSGKMLLRLAAMILLVLSLNIITVTRYKKNSTKKVNEDTQILMLTQEYFETDNLYIY